MNHSIYKVALATPKTSVGNCSANVEEHLSLIKAATKEACDFIVFPELSLTGFSCADLFFSSRLMVGALAALEQTRLESEQSSAVIVLGTPLLYQNKLYNCAVLLQGGKYLAVIPSAISNRWFAGYDPALPLSTIQLNGQEVPFGNLVFTHKNLRAGIAFANSQTEFSSLPSQGRLLVANEANCLLSLANCPATLGHSEKLQTQIQGFSQQHHAALLCSTTGASESTTDVVYEANHLLCNNGELLLSERKIGFESWLSISEFDLSFCLADRIMHRNEPSSQLFNKFKKNPLPQISIRFSHRSDSEINYNRVLFNKPAQNPFFPKNEAELPNRCQSIFEIQSAGLIKRLLHTHSQSVVIGISGGLDSTLALLVCHHAFIQMKLSPKGIIAVTLPGFGTTDRTYQNACALIKKLGCTFKEISIKEACLQHFKDIQHDVHLHDITYENAQARERTQILMDLANQNRGLVIGTGDLSELALGWATYNGDHLSMYGVNADVPKTLVKEVVRWASTQKEYTAIAANLIDVIETPVSPELIPADANGKIAQKTEELVGPYPLHDFFLYYTVRWGFTPTKIFIYAKNAFDGIYDTQTILHWLETFCRRFFSQQFKRSCLPDGPQIGNLSLSPRGAFSLPSDVDSQLWQDEIKEIRRNV